MLTILTTEPATCSACQQPAQCLVVTIADDPNDPSRDAYHIRKMVAPVCRRCIDRTFTPTTFARSRFDECPVQGRQPRADEPGWYSDERKRGES